MNCYGFVGGFVFPILTISIIAGTVCHMYYRWLPYGLCLSCFFVGVPGGVCPMPFTLSLLAIFVFFFGTYQTAPIFISALTSYTLVCGSGFFKMLRMRAQKADTGATEVDVDANPEAGLAMRTRVGDVDSGETISYSLVFDKYLDAKPSSDTFTGVDR